MKKNLITVLAVFLCVGVCFAQNGKDARARPDFSGTWVISETETKIPGFDFEVTNGFVTEIAHRDPELKITTKAKKDGQFVSTKEVTYYTDGRGEVNEVSSKTKWKGKKLVSKLADKDTEVFFELSDDGSRLIQTRVIKTRITLRILGTEETKTNKSEIKIVYTRVAGTS